MIIRKANSTDISQLTNLVKEWIASQTLFPAVDESFAFAAGDKKAPYACLSEPEIIIWKDLLNEPESLYYCVVAENEEENALVGYALCTYNYAIWIGKSIMLENIFVKENYRKKGIGTQLMAAIYQHAIEQGYLQVNFLTTKDDQCVGFFKKMEARDLTDSEGWLMYGLSRENMISTEKYLNKMN